MEHIIESILDLSHIVVTKENVYFFDGYDKPKYKAESNEDIRKALESIALLEEQGLLKSCKGDGKAVLFAPLDMFCRNCGKLMLRFPDCKRCLGCGNLIKRTL